MPAVSYLRRAKPSQPVSLSPATRAEYESRVRNLYADAKQLRASGFDSESIARAMHEKRRELSARFKEITSEPLRSRLYERTLAKYGDPIGPTIEFLRNSGKSWEEIIESATRHGSVPGEH